MKHNVIVCLYHLQFIGYVMIGLVIACAFFAFRTYQTFEGGRKGSVAVIFV